MFILQNYEISEKTASKNGEKWKKFCASCCIIHKLFVILQHKTENTAFRPFRIVRCPDS